MRSNNRGRQAGGKNVFVKHQRSISFQIRRGWWDRWSWSRFANNKVAFSSLAKRKKSSGVKKPSLVLQDCEGRQVYVLILHVITSFREGESLISMIHRDALGSEETGKQQDWEWIPRPWHVFGELRLLREITRLSKRKKLEKPRNHLAILVRYAPAFLEINPPDPFFLWCSCG